MMKFKTRLSLIATAALMATVPATAQAALVSFSNLTATWLNVAGGSNITFTGGGTGTAEVEWGTPTSAQSGYTFARAGNPITTNVPPSTPFTLGTFTHANNPITSGTSITAVTLRLMASISVDGSAAINRTFDYRFNHNETPNQTPCTFPGGAACADQVTVGSLPSSQMFSVNGVNYTLAFSGFQLPNGQTTTAFTSNENGTNSALLRATISATAVPEPASWAMMISGFGLIGGGMRRRRTQGNLVHA